jgi:hypothetical protein
MQILFLLDNREFVPVTPETLQLRQISIPTDDKPDAPYQVGLGVEVTVPVNKEDGTPDTNEDGTPKTQQAFRPFITYGALLTKVPQPAVATPAVPAVAATNPPAPAITPLPGANGVGTTAKRAKKSGK